MSDHDQTGQEAQSRIAAAEDLNALEALRVEYLGKQGSISGLLKTLGKMTPEERQEKAPAIQALRQSVADALTARKDRAGNGRTGSAACDRNARPDPARARRPRRAACIRSAR